jgi:CheY-like chemotaxis protein
MNSSMNPKTSKGRILIVDDEPVLRSMASSMLTMQGWEVLAACSAEEAEQLLKYCVARQIRVDTVIMDLIMPGGMSGMEALQSLRVLQPELRMVASSGFLVGEESREACLAMGFDDMLPKPYTMENLGQIVERNTGGTPAYLAA